MIIKPYPAFVKGYPVDNSWAYCYEDNKNYYLAGTNSPFSYPQIVTIISKPFNEDVIVHQDILKSYSFIKVRDENGRKHRILNNIRLIEK